MPQRLPPRAWGRDPPIPCERDTHAPQPLTGGIPRLLVGDSSAPAQCSRDVRAPPVPCRRDPPPTPLRRDARDTPLLPKPLTRLVPGTPSLSSLQETFCAPLNSCTRNLLSPMRGYPGAEARDRGLKEGTGDPHILSTASLRDPTPLQPPGPQRPGWRVLSIPALAACHHAWRSVTRSTSSAPGPWEGGELTASLQPWKLPGGARNRGDSERGHAGMRGSSQGQTGQPGASPWIPRRAGCFVREAWRRWDSGKRGDVVQAKAWLRHASAPHPVWRRGADPHRRPGWSRSDTSGGGGSGELEAVTAETRGWGAA